MMPRVAGKTAIVTGAGSGIGREIARVLAQEGASVVVTDIDADSCRQVAEEICREGHAAHPMKLDTTSEAEWIDTIDATISRFGRLDIAVNCAGISQLRIRPEDMSLEDWRRVMSVNLDGVFLGVKHQIRVMESGSIVNVSSIMGIVALADVAAYNASKGGVRLLTKSAALSCAEQNKPVRVNSVHPGFIDTPMVRRSMAGMSDPEEAERVYNDLQPLRCLGKPIDVAFGVLYLASDEASFVTGSELVIDGGYTAR